MLYRAAQVPDLAAAKENFHLFDIKNRKALFMFMVCLWDLSVSSIISSSFLFHVGYIHFVRM